MANDLGFIDPTYSGGNGQIAMAPRPLDLAGKVIGLLDNTKEQANLILKTVGDAFVEHFAASREWEEREYRRHVSDWELDRYFEII